MLTQFITSVTTKFNPFCASSKPARLFLAFLPPTARSSGQMTVSTQLLPRGSTEKPTLHVKFKDGKEMNLDPTKLGIKSIVEEVDRHSRILQKAADLANA